MPTQMFAFSSTRFAGAPSRREPFVLSRGNPLPDKRFLPALFRLPPGGSSRPQAGEGERGYRNTRFATGSRLTDKPQFEILPPAKNPDRHKTCRGSFLRGEYHSILKLYSDTLVSVMTNSTPP